MNGTAYEGGGLFSTDLGKSLKESDLYGKITALSLYE